MLYCWSRNHYQLCSLISGSAVCSWSFLIPLSWIDASNLNPFQFRSHLKSDYDTISNKPLHLNSLTQTHKHIPFLFQVSSGYLLCLSLLPVSLKSLYVGYIGKKKSVGYSLVCCLNHVQMVLVSGFTVPLLFHDLKFWKAFKLSELPCVRRLGFFFSFSFRLFC